MAICREDPRKASLEEIYLPTSKISSSQFSFFFGDSTKICRKKWHSQKNTELNSNFDGFWGGKQTNKSAKRVPQGKSEPDLPTYLRDYVRHFFFLRRLKLTENRLSEMSKPELIQGGWNGSWMCQYSRRAGLRSARFKTRTASRIADGRSAAPRMGLGDAF